MRGVLLSLALLALALCPSRAAEPPNRADPIWSSFTYQAPLFVAGTAVLNASLAASSEACALSCSALDDCRWWTWCDAAASSSTGCPLSAAFTPLADLPTDAGTCLVSADPGGLGAAFVMDGGAGWAGGQRLLAAPAGAPAPSGAASYCVFLNDTLLSPTLHDPAAVELGTQTGVATLDACCSLCQGTLGCTLFAWCQADAASCQSIPGAGSGGVAEDISALLGPSSSAAVALRPADCRLYNVADPAAEPVAKAHPELPWSSGYLAVPTRRRQ
ncbi:hypothetical protein ABPG77_010256 [Micractinium sp. CCAP 211/92]